MTDIVKQLDIKPLSIRNEYRTTVQVELIVTLIKSCIENGKALTIDDIIDCYIQYQHKSTRHRRFHIFRYNRWEKLTEIEFRTHYQTKTKSQQWFRNNLGSAIIQGKLLVIPVIEI